VATGIAAFAVSGGATRTVDVEAAPPVRSASVVKPLLAWAAAATMEQASWEQLARPMISSSDNAATATLWAQAGGDELVARLDDLAGVVWPVEDGPEHRALRLLVTARDLAQAYGALVADDGGASRAVLQWMRDVVAGQSFGLRAVAAEASGARPEDIALKCGWFGGERVHAVVLVSRPDRTDGATVTTTWTEDEATTGSVRRASGDDLALAAAHEAFAGETVRSAVRRALLEVR
jgi:hypothetical protein